MPLGSIIYCMKSNLSQASLPLICWFVDVPYRTKIVQNVLQHLALPTLVLCILPTMEFIRIIQQRADYFTSTRICESGCNSWMVEMDDF